MRRRQVLARDLLYGPSVERARASERGARASFEGNTSAESSIEKGAGGKASVTGMLTMACVRMH